VPCTADLSDTVNLWGAPPAAARGAARGAPETVCTYPALYNAELKAPIAAYAGVRPEEDRHGLRLGRRDRLRPARLRRAGGGSWRTPAPTFSMVPS
jgi:hypothetical protein